MIVSRLIPLLMIIGAIAIAVGYVQPTYSGSIADLKAEIASLDTALEAAERFTERQAELERQRAEIPPDQLARLEAFLPDNVDNVRLILDLTGLAARSGVELSAFDTEGGPTAEGAATAPASVDEEVDAYTTEEVVDSLKLTVSAVGSYSSFRTFLDGVESSLRPLDLVELSVTDSDTGVYTYDMTFDLYWLR